MDNTRAADGCGQHPLRITDLRLHALQPLSYSSDATTSNHFLPPTGIKKVWGQIRRHVAFFSPFSTSQNGDATDDDADKVVE